MYVLLDLKMYSKGSFITVHSVFGQRILPVSFKCANPEWQTLHPLQGGRFYYTVEQNPLFLAIRLKAVLWDFSLEHP